MDKTPLFRQIKDHLARRIAAGELRPGQQVPTELELSEQFSTTRVTVRRAIEELVDEGLLVRRGRRGTFVASQRWDREMNRFHSLFEDLQRRGLRPVTRLLDIRVMEPSEEVAGLLQIDCSQRVIRLRRLRLLAGEPLVLMEDFVPLSRCPQLLEDDLESQPLYQLMEERHGFRVQAGRQTIYLHRLSAKQAALLDQAAGDSALAMRATVLLEDGTPLLTGTYLFRGDRYSFSVTLRR